MKTAFLIAAAAFAALVPSGAITPEDITPAKLFGKTLIFTIEDSAPPFADQGVWKGKFQSSPADGFAITNVSGKTLKITTTRTYLSGGEYEAYSLQKLFPGSGIGILSIFTSPDGTGNYDLRLRDDETAYQSGTFTISSVPADAPDISVQQPKGSDLTNGKSKKSFGTVKVGKSGIPKVFTIKNTGSVKLTGLAISKSGANNGDFIVSGPSVTSLAPGKTTTFTVSFTPASVGTKSAVIKIDSNDIDEKPFVIAVAGEGSAQ